jgi:SAM-dependent methyltransferase
MYTEMLTGTIDVNGHARVFPVPSCGVNVTIPKVTNAFFAHMVEWSIMGKQRAWWSVLTGLPQTPVISEEHKTQFYASGDTHVSKVLVDLGLAHVPRRVLDFGCGLGRLAFAFAARGSHVTCIDQSVHPISASHSTNGGSEEEAGTRGRISPFRLRHPT